MPNYYGVGHNSNDNYIAMISGQAPNPQTQADCQTFSDMLPGTIGSGGQAQGTGCVYPAAVPTIASQLDQAGFTWRSYNEGMGADPTRETSVCAHPAVGASDNTQSATATDEYATRHNPFVYFHGIIDDTTLCDTPCRRPRPLASDLGSVADHAELHLHHPRPLQRRTRRAVQERPARRPGLGQRSSCRPGSRRSPPRRPTGRTGC